MQGKTRTTQPVDKTALFGISPTGVPAIRAYIEAGEEPRTIFQMIVDATIRVPGVEAAALYLSNEKNVTLLELAGVPSDLFPRQIVESQEEPGNLQDLTLLRDSGTLATNSMEAVEVICVGAPVGALVYKKDNFISADHYSQIELLAHHASVVFERLRLQQTLQNFLDRIQIFNELNQLIVSNVGFSRLIKSLTRDVAFRFASDLAVTLISDEESGILDTRGVYGCSMDQLPYKFNPQEGVLGQVMRVGGHLSITQLDKAKHKGMEQIYDLGIKSIEICSLEVQGQNLGCIMIGYRRDMTLSRQDLVRLEEFCQGSAVALSNARAQERLSTYAEKLEDLVEQRTADLAIQTAKAEEANKAKSRFLANMSHELRTPLTAIVGYSSVLADGLFGEVNTKQKDALNSVVRSSQHLKTLIDDVLNLARIESGKEQAEPSAVLLNDLLAQTQKLMLQTSLSKGVTLKPLNVPQDILNLNLFSDPKHTQQILINLVSNAVKYTPQGGSVWIEAHHMIDRIKIEIHDTGVGISPEKLSRLFERFERGEDAYSKSQEGTGIGLNLTKQLVELNGGTIGCESEIGNGSIFWIMLPLAKDTEDSESEKIGSDDQLNLSGITALVVDDNKDTCDVLKHILGSKGAEVVVANTVRDGINELTSREFSIVVTDLSIPGESGLALIDHIRTGNTDLKDLPIVVLSACAFEVDREAAMNHGASIFIPKPFKPSDVLKNIKGLTAPIPIEGQSKGDK